MSFKRVGSVFIVMALAAGLGACLIEPALAVDRYPGNWFLSRQPAAAAPLASPSGWRLGACVTSPYTLGVSFGYLWAANPVGFKLGGDWGIMGAGSHPIAFNFQDYRLFCAVTYALAPQPTGGPYIELGLGAARSSGAVRELGWPLLPHLGFGDVGRFNSALGWDINFSAEANGLLLFGAGVLY
jgi:hypothetical protein